MQRHRQQIPSWLLPMNILLSVAVAMLGTWVWLLSAHGLPPEQLQAMQLVYKQIVEQHVDALEGENLMWSAIEGMVGSVDEYSKFVRPSDVAEFETDTRGSYVGIGVVIDTRGGEVRIRFPFGGGPSERARLEVGDQIVAVDGVRLEAASDDALQDVARQHLLGPAGTTVEVTVRRDGETFERRVERGYVQEPSVKWVHLADPEQGIGYLYLKAFQEETSREFAAALEKLDRLARGRLRGLIVDLRFNRGGLLDEAVALTNVFIDSGVIVSLNRRDSSQAVVHRAEPEKCKLPLLPLVLLVNEASASASEVMAGALQDHERAYLVGTRTWGKALVQTIFSWRDLDYKLKLTTAHYLTPLGRVIQRRELKENGEADGGIEPDRTVALDDRGRGAIWRALHETYEPPDRYLDEVIALAQQEGVRPPTPTSAAEDAQLAAGLEEIERALQTPSASAESR